MFWIQTDGKKWAALGSGVGFYSFLGLNCLPGLSCGSDDKESACNAGDLGLIPGSGRSPGGGNGNPLQHACLENFKDRGAWQATVHEVTESDMNLENKYTHTLSARTLNPEQPT